MWAKLQVGMIGITGKVECPACLTVILHTRESALFILHAFNLVIWTTISPRSTAFLSSRIQRHIHPPVLSGPRPQNHFFISNRSYGGTSRPRGGISYWYLRHSSSRGEDNECGRWWTAEPNVNKLWPSRSVTKTVRDRPQISVQPAVDGRHPGRWYSGNFAEALLRLPEAPGVSQVGHGVYFAHVNRECRWGLRYSRRGVFTLADTARSSVISCDIIKLYVEAELKLKFIEMHFGRIPRKNLHYVLRKNSHKSMNR